MPRFLNTRGTSNLGIAICDRCKRKFPIGELSPDRNTPGLMVCREDNDEFDPWRLPAISTEDITLPFYRPDVPIGVTPEAGDPGIFRITETNDDYRDTDEDDFRVLEVFP